jgi:periplasmic protein TonB
VKEARAGILASVALHACVITLIAGLSVGAQSAYKPVKTVVLDFTILKAHDGPDRDGSGSTGKKEGKSNGKRLAASIEATTLKPVAIPQPQNAPRAVQPHDATKTAHREAHEASFASDPEGLPVVRGNTASAAHRGGGRGIGFASSGGGSGMGGTGTGTYGSGSGSGGSGGDGVLGGKDYFYIRDRVLKNIKYPEKARRMGIEGQVLLSFTVLESGTTSDVRIVRSSGSRVLDEDAKETVARTKIDRTVTYRAAVSLPITYKLH